MIIKITELKFGDETTRSSQIQILRQFFFEAFSKLKNIMMVLSSVKTSPFQPCYPAAIGWYLIGRSTHRNFTREETLLIPCSSF